jgi:hypothetical protein
LGQIGGQAIASNHGGSDKLNTTHSIAAMKPVEKVKKNDKGLLALGGLV